MLVFTKFMKSLDSFTSRLGSRDFWVTNNSVILIHMMILPANWFKFITTHKNFKKITINLASKLAKSKFSFSKRTLLSSPIKNINKTTNSSNKEC